MNKKLKKYLHARTTKGLWTLSKPERDNYKAAIIIPALAERNYLPETLASLATNPAEYQQQTLILIVINNRTDISDDQLQDNQQVLQWLKSNPFPDLNIAWVDASSSGLELPAKGGVGLARKIGFDLALVQLDWSQQPLLISLDADTLVDENYLSAIFEHFRTSQSGAATIPFRHRTAGDPQQEAAIRQYELYLRSYLFGLQQAGSPYAYHTIGSAFACRAEAYVAAGGMNRRSAAEDFYLLQQLEKTSGVEMLGGTVVRPSPRFSNRVPFGTGKAVQGQVEDDRQLFQFSSVAAFKVLQRWLALVGESLELPAETLIIKATELSPSLTQFILELNFPIVWSRMQKNHTNLPRRQNAFHCWFDALRSRQLLTRLDDDGDFRKSKLVAELLEWGGYSGVNRWEDQLSLLEQLQLVGKI